jgi:hypothetical protein
MDFDFRFRNAGGKWESVGHRKGADRATALEALSERSPGGLPPGQYMSRPRSRQKDWDLFSLDRNGEISTPVRGTARGRSLTPDGDQRLHQRPPTRPSP